MNANFAAAAATYLAMAFGVFPQPGTPPLLPPPPPPRYSEFPLPADLKAAFKNRLKQATGLTAVASFPAILKQLANLKMFGPEAGKKLAAFDNYSRVAIENYLDSMIDPGQAKLSPEMIRKLLSQGLLSGNRLKAASDNRSDAAQLQRELSEFLTRLQGRIPVPPPSALPSPGPVEPIEPPTDEFRDWLMNMMDRAEQSRWGEYLQNSPGWQKVMEDMKAPGSMGPMDKSLQGLTGWAAQLKWRPDINLNLRNLRVPDLGRLGFRPGLPGLPRFALPRPGLPNFSAPAVSLSAPSAGDLQALGWVVLIVAALVLLYTLFRSSAARRTVTRAALGPWPVAPGEVSTRRQLVQAFDYLAIMLLGADAQSWNHRRAAAALGKNEANRPAAERLAEIYETARYTDGPDALPETLREGVRGDLRLLAGLG